MSIDAIRARLGSLSDSKLMEIHYVSPAAAQLLMTDLPELIESYLAIKVIAKHLVEREISSEHVSSAQSKDPAL